jgi:Tol biopolymer transport system component/DNA-binding winged helix-turn-helix (wHTH) protein
VAAHDDVSADAMRPPPKLATQAVHADKNAVYEFGDYRLEPRRRLLTRAGETLPVAGKAFDALVYLVEHAGELVTRQALAEALWPSTIVEENNLNQAISALRRVLGDDCIVTVARRGYQFTADVRRVLVADTSAAPAGPAVAESALRPRTRLATFVALIGAVLILLVVVLWLAYRPQAVAVDNFLDAYAFSKVTEFEGVDEQAAISRDGRYVAFLREREDSWDAWVGEIGTGLFRNLTEGTLEELRNPAVRTLRFTPDGTRIVVWSRSKPDNGGIVDAGTAYPTLGGPAQAYRKGIAELDWSPDGRRIVYHTAAAGDPLFVADAEEKGDGRLIHRADPGVHNHFPVWSPAGEYIYFVRGFVSDQMNIWRIRPDGRDLRRLTFHESSVSFPTFVDERRLLYLATADDGSGPWVHALDLDDFQVQRLDTRGQEYASLAASADGSRIVATESHRSAALWRAPLRAAIVQEADATRLDIPTPRGESPRFGPGFVVFRAPKAGTDGLWKITEGSATELWSGADGRVSAGAAIAPDGLRIAFPVQRQGRTLLHVIDADGGNIRRLAEMLDVRGAPAWSPDGKWIAIGAMQNATPRLFKIPLDGGAPVALGSDYAVSPAWSPSGRFLVYAGADVGTNFRVSAVNADGTPRVLPELVLSRGASRFVFLSENEIVVLGGSLSHKELRVVDLSDGRQRELTAFGAGPTVRDFDVAADGKAIIFDRVRAESDIVLMQRQPP